MAIPQRGLALAALWTFVQGASAQETPDPRPQDQKPQEPQQDQKDILDELDDLRFRVDTLEQELANERAARSTAPQSASVFNPAITVFGNFVARWDDQPVFVDDDPTSERIDDRFHLRETEVDFRAAIDPWADGVLIAALESEVPGEFESTVEEGYLVLKKLPLLDSAPAGLKVKVGRFRTEFGRMNPVHLHDLPQPSYPRSLGNFLGTEGLVQDGVSGQFFVPLPGENQSLEAFVQVLDGGGAPVADDLQGNDIATLGHLKYFRDLGPTSNVEVGLSGWENDSDHQLLGVDATYKWKPLSAGEWHSFLFGGELFASRLDDPALGDDPLGWYLFGQYQLSKNTYAGVRYDRSEEVEDESLDTTSLGTYLTYYTTEFLRFRLGVEHAESDVDELDGLNTGLLELNLVFGSHPVEPYWVNR